MRHINRVRGFSSLALVVLAGQSIAAAQTPTRTPGAESRVESTKLPAYRYRLLGVYDEQTGAPIEGVEVRDMLTGTSALTSSTGTVSLVFLPDSGSLVRLRKVGYEPQTTVVSISPDHALPLTVTLREAAQQLPGVNVKASAPTGSWRLREAEERILAHAGGYFIDEATMRKLDNTTLADAMRSRMPGMMSAVGPHGETWFLSSRTTCKMALSCAKPDCFITTYLDGIQVTQRPDFDRLSPQDYAIAEFYAGPAEVPAQYASTATCGVLLLWSRER